MMSSRFGSPSRTPPSRKRDVNVSGSPGTRPDLQQKTMCGQVRKLLDFISPGCPRNNESEKVAPLDSPKRQVNRKSCPMDTAEFRKRGREMVDYIADYLETISQRRVTPNIEPGYLRHHIPYAPPNKGEEWEDIMKDVERHIMPGVTHWQHPRFHAYFPAGNSYPSILADMLSDAIGCVGFSWAASPACTELETIMLDWLGNMIGLPEDFLCLSDKSRGGGVIQGSASDCVLVCLLAARHATIRTLKQQHPFVEEGVLLSKLMAYCSKEAHSSVEKAAMIGFVKLRILDTDDRFQLRGTTLAKAMEEDRAMGLIPFFVAATLGTTSCCSFDPLHEIGPVCQKDSVWLHVDAAYAGSALICPEFQHLLRGIEYAMSFNMNPNKWMLVNFDCSTMWVKDRFKLTQALVVDPLYLQHSYSDKSIDYRHWGIPLSRRFRSLKLWFVIRKYGVEGLQKYIREHVRLAKKFESLVRKDDRFEVVNHVQLGLVCFRLKGSNHLNQKLLSSINASGKLHMVPASLNERYVIRFCVCAQHATDDDITHAWEVITQFTEDVIELMKMDSNKEANNVILRKQRYEESKFKRCRPLTEKVLQNLPKKKRWTLFFPNKKRRRKRKRRKKRKKKKRTKKMFKSQLMRYSYLSVKENTASSTNAVSSSGWSQIQSCITQRLFGPCRPLEVADTPAIQLTVTLVL